MEHGGNRTFYAQLVAQHYHTEYAAIFGPLPDLSAFPAAATPVTAPETLAAWATLTSAQQADVTQIFVNIGLSQYSDAEPSQCAELRFMVAEGHELVRQYKPPSLRGVAARPPYMHTGQFATLEEVLDHYNRGPRCAGRPQ